MNILAIDASLNGTGYCLYSHAFGFVTGAVKVNPDSTRFERIGKIIPEILALAVRADRIFIEDYAFSRNSQSTTALAELGGVLRWELRKHDMHWKVITSTAIKKFTTGKGNAKKNEMLLAVYKR